MDEPAVLIAFMESVKGVEVELEGEKE